VNEVRITFDQAFSHQEGLRLDRWVSALDCLQEYEVVDPQANRRSRRLFRPDGYFRYLFQGRLFGCFLEVDRSTMCSSRFQMKVRSYLEYAQSGLYPRTIWPPVLPVLVISKTRERLLNLKAATKPLTEKIFWFTVMDHLVPDQILGPIWYRPGKKMPAAS